MSAKLPNPVILILVGAVVAAVAAFVERQHAASQSPGVVQTAPAVVVPSAVVSPDPITLLDQAITTLDRRQSISARVRQTVDLFNRRPIGSGTYLEQYTPKGRQFRLEMRMQVDDQTASLLHVTDGEFLWRYRQYQDSETLARIDLTRVRRQMEESGKLPQPGEVGLWPWLGGLPRLLRSLAANFDFTRIEQLPLRNQIPAWRLQGAWKSARLAKLLPDQAKKIQGGKPPNLAKLSKHIPDHVVLFLGADDLFPYRIEYRRYEEKKGVVDAAHDKPLVEIDFYDVAADIPIEATRFHYSPENVSPVDETDKFLQSIGLGGK